MLNMYALLSLLLISNASLFSMQLTRIIKKGTHSTLKHHKPAQKQILRRMYENKTLEGHTPTRQACSKLDDCVCIKPFMANSTVEYCENNSWEHTKALKRLDSAIRYFEHTDDTQTLQKLMGIKKQLCSNTEICNQVIGRRDLRVWLLPPATITAITVCIGIATGSEDYCLIVPVVAFASLFVSGFTSNFDSKGERLEMAIRRHRSNEIALITKTFKELRIKIPLRDINIVYDNDKDTWL